jgi:hypothetical protein
MESGITRIDEQKNLLFSRAERISEKFKNRQFLNLKDEARQLKEDIRIFRAGLGASRGTEFLEGRFKWTEKFDQINKEIDLITNLCDT